MNMSRLFLFTAVALSLTFPLPGAVKAAQQQHAPHGHSAPDQGSSGSPEKESAIYTAKGTVVEIDTAGKKITIAHDPIPALNWPAMTMRFAVEQPALLSGLKAGDAISFDFRNRGKESILLDVEVLR